MEGLLTSKEKRSIRKKLSKVEDIKINIDDIDYNEIGEALMESQLSSLVNRGQASLMIEKAEDGNYYDLDQDGQPSNKIDEKYYKIVESYSVFASEEKVDFNIIKKMYSIMEEFLSKIKFFGKKADTHKKQIIKLAGDIDVYYTEMRKGIIDLENNHSEEVIETLLVLPDLIVYFLRYLASDEVSFINKSKIILALTYIISPFDIIPEAIVGSIGYLDDLYIAIKVFQTLLFDESMDQEQIYRMWPGKKSTVDNIDYYFDEIRSMLGNKLTRVIDIFFNKIR